MNNPIGTPASREEAIAYQVLEAVLGVVIEVADASGQSGMVDGRWELEGGTGAVEVTGPDARDQMREIARAEAQGRRWRESGSVPAHLGTLSAYLSEELAEPWAIKNVEKLRRSDATERHLYLIGRSVAQSTYYARLSDVYRNGWKEPVGSLQLPAGLTDVWYAGRASRGSSKLDGATVRAARFNVEAGWSTHEVHVPERRLPPPKLVADPAPANWREAPRYR